MLRVEQATAYPNNCQCGYGRAPFVDTGLERYGERIYWCSRCIASAATILGWVEREHFESATVAMADADRRIAQLTEELEQERRPEAKVIRVEDIPVVLASVTHLSEYKQKKAAEKAKPKAAA
jgi:hypothetical protein